MLNSGMLCKQSLPFSVTCQPFISQGGDSKGRHSERNQEPLLGGALARLSWREGPDAPPQPVLMCHILGPSVTLAFGLFKQTLSLAWVSPALPSGCCCCLTIIWFLGPAETPWQGLAQDHLAECPSLHLFSHFKVMETEAQIEKRTHPQSHGE